MPEQEQPAFKREDWRPGVDSRRLTPYAIPVLDLEHQRYYDDFPLLYASDQEKLERLLGDGFIFASSAAVIGVISFYILDDEGHELERAVYRYTTTDAFENMHQLHLWIASLDFDQLRAKRREANVS